MCFSFFLYLNITQLLVKTKNGNNKVNKQWFQNVKTWVSYSILSESHTIFKSSNIRCDSLEYICFMLQGSDNLACIIFIYLKVWTVAGIKVQCVLST